MLRCMMRVETKVDQSRCAHENCESRWRKNVKDFSSIVSTIIVDLSSLQYWLQWKDRKSSFTSNFFALLQHWLWHIVIDVFSFKITKEMKLFVPDV